MMRHNTNNLRWCAEYINGKITHQYDHSNSSKSFSELARTNLKKISLIDGNKIIFSQDLIPGISPIYRLRNVMSSNINSNRKIHILGWVLWGDSLSNINTSISFIDDNTRLVESGFFIEGVGAGYKYPIQPTEEDYIPISWI